MPYKRSTDGCTAAFQLKLSLANKSWHDTKFRVNSWINLATVVVILLYLHFVRWFFFLYKITLLKLLFFLKKTKGEQEKLSFNQIET